MTKGPDVDDLKLPAIRNPSSLAEYEETPGSRLMEFLAYLRTELLDAIDTLREETSEQLDGGDPALRIQSINRLRMRKNRIEAHLVQEIRQIRELTRSLHGQSDKSVVDTLTRECKSVLDDVVRSLRDLIQEFGLE